MWNSLSSYVVSAESVNCFKNRLNNFWKDQEIIYNFRDLRNRKPQWRYRLTALANSSRILYVKKGHRNNCLSQNFLYVYVYVKFVYIVHFCTETFLMTSWWHRTRRPSANPAMDRSPQSRHLQSCDDRDGAMLIIRVVCRRRSHVALRISEWRHTMPPTCVWLVPRSPRRWINSPTITAAIALLSPRYVASSEQLPGFSSSLCQRYSINIKFASVQNWANPFTERACERQIRPSVFLSRSLRVSVSLSVLVCGKITIECFRRR